jgi:hypothetical protein
MKARIKIHVALLVLLFQVLGFIYSAAEARPEVIHSNEEEIVRGAVAESEGEGEEGLTSQDSQNAVLYGVFSAKPVPIIPPSIEPKIKKRDFVGATE